MTPNGNGGLSTAKNGLISVLFVMVMSLAGIAWTSLESRDSIQDISLERLEKKIDWLICREYLGVDKASCGRGVD